MTLRVRIALLVIVNACSLHAVDTVVIDAGHGGKDPGTAWNHLVEKDLCLDVAKRLEAVLNAKGKNTVMTRSTDEFIELSERARLANEHPDALFVSIHFNGTRDRMAQGYETHYRSVTGRVLAAFIQDSMKAAVPGRSRDPTWQDYKVLRETTGTAVLIECGFLSNKKEATNCGSANHRQKIADAIAEGLLKWM